MTSSGSSTPSFDAYISQSDLHIVCWCTPFLEQSSHMTSSPTNGSFVSLSLQSFFFLTILLTKSTSSSVSSPFSFEIVCSNASKSISSESIISIKNVKIVMLFLNDGYNFSKFSFVKLMPLMNDKLNTQSRTSLTCVTLSSAIISIALSMRFSAFLVSENG